MNIQAMMKQAQKMQKDMLNTKEEINKMIFTGESSFVKVEVNGNKELLSVKIDSDSIDKDDIELLQDMLVVAVNDAFKKVDNETDKKMSKYTQGMPGLF
jgi:DNA-binding YbaB/EbfC family protein